MKFTITTLLLAATAIALIAGIGALDSAAADVQKTGASGQVYTWTAGC